MEGGKVIDNGGQSPQKPTLAPLNPQAGAAGTKPAKKEP